MGKLLTQLIPQPLSESLGELLGDLVRERITQFMGEFLGELIRELLTQLMGECMGELLGECIPQCFTLLLGELSEFRSDLGFGVVSDFELRAWVTTKPRGKTCLVLVPCLDDLLHPAFAGRLDRDEVATVRQRANVNPL